MDFNLNGKVVTLQGWDLTVHKPQGEGRITSGNLINQTAFSVAYGAWNAGGGWYGFAGRDANSYGNRDVFQSFTVPKARDVYLQFRVHSWNNSGYNQYVSAGIDSVNNLISDFQSGTKTSSSSYYRTTGILKKTGLAEGSTHELQFTNSGGFTYAGDIFLCPTSKLIFDIPENEEYDLDGITLGGASDVDFSGIGLCVCKTGKGLLTMSKANPRFGGSGTTSLVVEDGTYGPNVLTESAEGYLTHPKVQLGDASHLNATLDLSQWTTTFDDREEGSLTFYAGTAEAPAEMTMAVDIGDRTADLGEYAYLWKEKPADTVKFVRSENMRRRGIHVLTTDDGIRFKTGLTIHIR